MREADARITAKAALAMTVGIVLTVAQAQDGWVSLGLEKHRVNCLLVDHAGRLLAGADNGLYLRDHTTWLKVTDINLPVMALALNGGGRVLAAIGDGNSRSDGVYLAEDILDGPPYYVVRVVAWMRGPGTLAVRPVASEPQVISEVLVGAGNKVYKGTLKGHALDLKELLLPPYCFGVEQPLCRVLHVFSGDGRCYAGGYDKSPMPGPGSLLVERGRDSMVTIRAGTNVSAIAERSQMPQRQPQLIVGTTDSGLFAMRFAPSDTAPHWDRIPGPASGDAITHLCPVPIGAAEEDGLLYAAVPSGVYRQCLSTQDCLWHELGHIPSTPLFVAHADAQSPLYAATDNGVYAYRDVLAVAGKGPGATGQAAEAYAAGGFSYDIRGRLVRGGLPAARGVCVAPAAGIRGRDPAVLRVVR